ncbi:MAG: hypothetical protein ACLTZT_19800 [Butyricimonas faecalis]
MSDGSFVNKSETLTVAKTACVGIVFALANEVDQSDYSTGNKMPRLCRSLG